MGARELGEYCEAEVICCLAHTYHRAVTEEDTLLVCDDNRHGQLGNVLLPPSLFGNRRVVRVACGSNLAEDGTACVWRAVSDRRKDGMFPSSITLMLSARRRSLHRAHRVGRSAARWRLAQWALMHSAQHRDRALSAAG